MCGPRLEVILTRSSSGNLAIAAFVRSISSFYAPAPCAIGNRVWFLPGWGGYEQCIGRALGLVIVIVIMTVIIVFGLRRRGWRRREWRKREWHGTQ